MPFTTRGFALLFGWAFRATAVPTQYYIALVTAAVVPSHDTKTLSELTEIAAGNGYTAGGYELDPNSTDFPSLTEDDVNQRTDITVKTVAWTAAAGDIPGSGNPARYLVLTTDEATVGDRQIIWYGTLGAARTALSGQALTIAGIQGRIQGGAVIKSIQRGTITIAGVVSNTATITAVDIAKSALRLLGWECESTNANHLTFAPRLTLTNTTTVTATRNTNSVDDTIVNFEVVEYF